MTYKNKAKEIRDFVAIEIINGRLKDGDRLFDKKFFTSKFKINPAYVDEAIAIMLDEGLIARGANYYTISLSNVRVDNLKNEFLNVYINDLLAKVENIGLGIDDVREVLTLRTVANG